MKRKIRIKNMIAILLIIAFIISLVPIFLISQCAIPASDDVGNSILLKQAVVGGKNIFDLILLALNHVKERYLNWQGTYTSMFLTAFQPGIFGENFYYLGTPFIIFTIIIANLFSCYTIFKKIIGQKDISWIICGIAISFLQLQYLPSAKEGIFWWSGAVMHTLILSILLMQFSLVFRLLKESSNWIIHTIIALILTVIIGGGAHEIALLSFTMYLLVYFLFLYIHKINKLKVDRKKHFVLILLLIVSLVCLGINILAPGNQVRLSQSSVNVSAVSAILQSFGYSMIYSFKYLNVGTAFVMFLFFYFSYPKIKKSNLRMINPALLLLVTWCVYSSIFTPAIYGENYVAAPRYLNILYFSFFWFLIGNELLLMIYYKENKYLDKLYHLIKEIISGKFILALVVFVVIGCSSILSFNYHDTTSLSAFIDLINGNARSFYQTNVQRQEMLNDKTIDFVILPEYKKEVNLLLFDKLTVDNDSIVNNTYEQYYNKKSIKVAE